MNKFLCNVCQYTLEGETPPEKFASSGTICSFVDANCYTLIVAIVKISTLIFLKTQGNKWNVSV